MSATPTPTVATPVRLHRPPVRGWRPPENAVYVGPGSIWENPYRWRTPNALARVPALDGSPWEYETRISSAGRTHAFHHADGRVTRHRIRYMTRRECLDLYEQALTNPTPKVRLWQHGGITVATVVRALAGHDLVCRCALGQLCHADVLLRIANTHMEDPS